MRTWARFGALVAIATALVACSPSDPRVTIVDGWSIGRAIRCGNNHPACEVLVDRATQALARREPGHAAIAQISVHEEGSYPCESGGGTSTIVRSGAAGVGPVVLFVLVDGSRKAVSVGFALGGVLVAHEQGPGVAPWECTNGPPPTQHPTEVAAPA